MCVNSSPADESWRTINAMDDLCLAILTCTSHVTVAAMQGNAGAGGVFMALAADYVFARQGIVLNPHYRGMGNLYGSEYWTYLLPQRVGAERSDQIAHSCLPIGTDTAQQWGLIDEAEDGDVVAHAIAKAPTLTKRRTPPDRPLADYRAKELERMRLNFYGFDPSYHVARFNFIHKIPKSRTPSWLARHRG